MALYQKTGANAGAPGAEGFGDQPGAPGPGGASHGAPGNGSQHEDVIDADYTEAK